MTWWQSIVLGLVEGLTEYLPVSSTGHLLLAQRAMGIASSEAADAYAICIQVGAILAVLGLYYRRVWQMALGFLGRDPEGLRLGLSLLGAFIPSAFIGLLLEKPIKRYLFAGEDWGMWPIVAAWFVGGLVILAIAWRRQRHGVDSEKGLDMLQMTWQMAVVIGLLQCVAMWPGTSRSLVTILGGLLVGLNLKSAVEFSFLLGVVTLTAATGYDALKHGAQMATDFGGTNIVLGLFFSWLSAVCAVKWMVAYLNRYGLALFGYYRIVLAVVVTVLLLTGVLTH